ncbi:hypothetical protein ED733_000969 [Metarhizium rileyi]|uniref:Uncharacterized protein n=1 Tax=Metarhizium rileyi (strain RCEF 4871) TaxID=1649241 RepID=A0A5C6GA87_METRR|nr:hypothetical protein ED733_000969 [Metarhizium rileyi]
MRFTLLAFLAAVGSVLGSPVAEPEPEAKAANYGGYGGYGDYPPPEGGYEQYATA